MTEKLSSQWCDWVEGVRRMKPRFRDSYGRDLENMFQITIHGKENLKALHAHLSESIMLRSISRCLNNSQKNFITKLFDEICERLNES